MAGEATHPDLINGSLVGILSELEQDKTFLKLAAGDIEASDDVDNSVLAGIPEGLRPALAAAIGPVSYTHLRRIGLGDRLVKGTCLGPAQRGGRIQNAFGGEVGIAAYRAQPRIMFDRRADLSVSQTFNNGDAMFLSLIHI